jgi:hypothetical protein
MSADIDDYLKDLNSSKSGDDWVEAMENYVDCLDGSCIEYLGAQDTSFMVTRGPNLMVVFETAEDAVSRSPNAFPTGWDIAESKGWSYLAIMSSQEDLVPSKLIFDHIDKIAGPEGPHAEAQVVFIGLKKTSPFANAVSARVMGSTLVLLQPEYEQADTNRNVLAFPGNAANSQTKYLAYDPQSFDARGQGFNDAAVHLRCWHMRDKTDQFLRAFDMLPTVFDMAATGATDTQPFYAEMRDKRRQQRAYWRWVLRSLDTDKRPELGKTLCEAVSTRLGGRTFRKELQRLEAA